ncbi:hypothetical protein ccbrp13_42570 [Ktedonobacteria bacterium brp13]|nr:hypothetical protein ccbrp13_42570 [Ktedonobacteria bacterium brp13]
MSKDHLERRMYRKSPGRQYGYDYDPLRSRSDTSQASQKSTASRAGTVLVQRPDPRRTRQLLRKSIIASKQHPDEYPENYEEEAQPVQQVQPVRKPAALSVQVTRRLARTEHIEQLEHSERSVRLLPGQRRPPESEPLLLAESGYSNHWPEMSAAHPDLLEPYPSARHRHYEDEDEDEGYIDDYMDAAYNPVVIEPRVARPARASRAARLSQRPVDPKATRRLEPEEELEPLPSNRVYPAEEADYDYEYEFEEDRSSVTRSKKRLSRRSLLFGVGAIAAVGAGVAIVENAPKIPQAASNVAGDVTQQVQDAFNRGIAQGSDQARKDIINSLSSLEGFTLDGAITAARLTRVAYDVFVSPVVKFGSVLTGDFLTGMLTALTKAREWLAGVYQDNSTLIAIQKVLQSWVDDVQQLPKQLDSITEADLDGAQSYLRALQRKIQDEQAQLNKPAGKQATPTPVPKK